MIDIFIVFAYLATLLVVAIFSKLKLSKAKNTGLKSFSKISKNLANNKLLLVATIFASSIGGGTTFGVTEKIFAQDISYSYGLLCTIPVDIIVAIFIVPKLLNYYGAETVGDIMHKYYGNTGRFISGFAAIMVSLGLIAAQISVSGHVFEYILQLDHKLGVIISYTIVVIYTTIGGLNSVLFANRFQFFVIIIAIPIISLCGLYQLGITDFINSVPQYKYSFLHNENLLKNTIGSALSLVFVTLLPTFIQRALISKQLQVTRTAIYIKSLIYGIFIIFITINGLLAFVEASEAKSSLALIYMLDKFMPNGIKGIIVAGLL